MPVLSSIIAACLLPSHSQMPSWNDGESRAWITIAGVETDEYDIQVNEDSRTVTCWIASELGKLRTLRCTGRIARYLATSTQKSMWMVFPAMEFSIVKRTHGGPCSMVKDRARDATHFRMFTFSSVELSDDDELLEQTPNSELGVIKLEIWQISIGNPLESSKMAEVSTGRVHERSKRGVSQQVKSELPRAQIFSLGSHVVSKARRSGDSEGSKAQLGNGEDWTVSLRDSEARRLRAQLEAVEAKLVLKKGDKKPRIKTEATSPSASADSIDLTQPRHKRVKRDTSTLSAPPEVIDLT
uniref:Uncharacterized protein n=1 Tax=Mycena chlorophos TaxID=658473 RepID=A0ABQ0LZ72_MYCCL|nr:predicted protein [Mycena chlorophos]